MSKGSCVSAGPTSIFLRVSFNVAENEASKATRTSSRSNVAFPSNSITTLLTKGVPNSHSATDPTQSISSFSTSGWKAEMKGYMKFDEIGKDLFVRFSYPIEKIDGLEEAGKGRYLNAVARVAVYVKKREFKLQLQEVLQNGQPLQIDSLSALQDRNLLSHFRVYEGSESQFNLIADVLFKDGKIFLRNWRDKYKKG